MDILGKLSGGLTREQVIINRIHNALKDNIEPGGEIKSENNTVDIDDAKFIQLHLKNKCNKYHMYFGEYTTEMFHKLCPFMWYKSYDKNSTVFAIGDPSKWFYYILDGTVHTLESDSSGNQKIANLYNENQLFGLKKSDETESIIERNREAVTETTTHILMFDVEEYEKIRKQRVLSAAETKIEFLKQYVPGLRSIRDSIIHDLEVLFQKEKVTKGYRLIEQGVINDNLLFIQTGECRILYNYNTNKKLKSKFDSLDISMPGLINIGKLGAGDWCGESSAITKTPWKYSVQVLSEEAEIYRISWNTFYNSFGKDNGAPIQRMRAKSVMNINWTNMIIKKLVSKTIESIMSDWEFVDKAHDKNSIRSIANESPFIK